ncbi:MAG: double zinc ribbon domain-containing protein [Lachnospiraceae bacterium]|nr:double zinc ribbon domain-containing protein [Lachnospiraceae bacterium]
MIELVFPRRCPICDRIVYPKGRLICGECSGKIRYIQEPRCKKCGKGLKKEEEEYCFDCGHKKHEYDQGIALYEYRSVQDSIFRFKYQGRCEYADFYARDMAEKLGQEVRQWNADAFIPVPIHYTRKNKRGYNQAEIIADALAGYISLPVYKDIVKRCKKTIPQKELDIQARQNNLKKAFKIARDDVKLESIILVDDIYTTGSTIDGIAGELKKAGIDKIYYIALSIGKGLS